MKNHITVITSLTISLSALTTLASCTKGAAPAAVAATPTATQVAAPTAVATVVPAPVATAPAAPAETPPAEQQQSALVKIASIEGREANEEFTRNVQVIQAQRQGLVKLTEEVKAAPEGKERDELQARVDAALTKLESDNALMAKSYGYSVLRNYVQIPERSEVHLVLTEEEIAKQPAPTDGSKPGTTIKVCALNDAQANQSFQTTVGKLQQMRQQAVTSKDAIDAAKDLAEKAYAQGQFDLLLKQLNDANNAATKEYSFNLNRQYVLVIERSTLYIAATPEEAAKAGEAEKSAAAKATK